VSALLQLSVQLVEHEVRQQGRQDAPNAMDNFEFEMRLTYRRGERIRRGA
jgi:hypothetical protein